MAAAKALLDWFTPPSDPPAMVWEFCAYCNGQRTIYVEDGIGGLVPGPCPWCLGLGEVVRP